jgi:hypothetical protein
MISLNFAQAQTSGSVTLPKPSIEQLLFPLRFKGLAEIIDGAKEFF